MASRHSRSFSDDEESLLEDSTYDLLTDSMMSLPSDDDDSASLSSSLLDDDTVSVEDTDFLEDDESEHELEDDDEVPDTAGIPTFSGLDNDQLKDSTLTVLEEKQQVKEDASSVVIKVHDHIDGLQIYPLMGYTKDEILEMGNRGLFKCDDPLPYPEQLSSSLSIQTPAKGLEVDHFRILYVGDEMAKTEIITKISSALIVRSISDEESKPARFNVIPVSSFGNVNADPEVELIESFGVQLTLDTCTIAGSIPKVLGNSWHDDLTLGISPRAVVTSTKAQWIDGHQIVPKDYKLPHLVVMYRTSNDSTQALNTREIVRKFTQRHSLPVLEISEKLDYYGQERMCTSGMEPMFMCLEGGSRGTIFKQAPIDRDTFFRIDVRQLNKSLAFSTQFASTAQVMYDNLLKVTEKCERHTALEDFSFTTNAFYRRNRKQTISAWLKERYQTADAGALLLLLLGLMSAIIAAFLAVESHKGRWIGLHDDTFQDSPTSSVLKFTSSSSVSSVVSISPSTVSASIKTKQSSSSTSIATLSTPISIKVISSSRIAKPSPKAAKSSSSKSASKALIATPSAMDLKDGMFVVQMKVNETEHFRLHVIGNGHIILKPADKFILRSKPPRLYVNVTRKDELIESELSQPFSNVYSISVNQEQAWGLVNVSIHTKQKPKVNVSYEVDLGSPWFKIAGLKKVAEKSSVDIVRSIGKQVSLVKNTAALMTTEVQRGLELFADQVYRQADNLQSSTKKVKGVSQQLLSGKAQIYQKAWSSEVEKLNAMSQKLLKQARSGVAMPQQMLKDVVGPKVFKAQKQAQKQAQKMWEKKLNGGKVSKKNSKTACKGKAGKTNPNSNKKVSQKKAKKAT